MYDCDDSICGYCYRRHVLKLHVKGPIAYHLTVLSNAEFQLSDEDNIYTFLSKVRLYPCVQCIPPNNYNYVFCGFYRRVLCTPVSVLSLWIHW